MKQYLRAMTFAAALGGTTTLVQADPPEWITPHGMLRVEVDSNNKLFSNTGLFDFQNKITTNAVGRTILTHNVQRFDTDLFALLLGGIADRAALPPANVAATASSKLLVTDDPGYLTDSLPANQLMRVNFHNSLRFFDGTSWTTPLNGEMLTVFDLSGADETGGPAADLQVLLTGDGSGLRGTFNIDVIQSAGQEVHGHLGYALARTDNGIPTVGAYMIELSLSALDISPGGNGPVLKNSDPIFIIFNNQLNASGFSAAVAGAQALPEPSTAVMLTLIGVGLIGLRKRNHAS